MDCIISNEKIGFVLGHSILNAIIVAQESIHTLKNTKRSVMIIKLDISKAYDNVDSQFLCKIMHAFGFDKKWIN